MCNEPSPGGNLQCIRDVEPDGTHKGGHIWVVPLSGFEIEQEEGEK